MDEPKRSSLPFTSPTSSRPYHAPHHSVVSTHYRSGAPVSIPRPESDVLHRNDHSPEFGATSHPFGEGEISMNCAKQVSLPAFGFNGPSKAVRGIFSSRPHQRVTRKRSPVYQPAYKHQGRHDEEGQAHQLKKSVCDFHAKQSISVRASLAIGRNKTNRRAAMPILSRKVNHVRA